MFIIFLVRYFISESETFRLDSSSKNLLLSFSMKPHAPIETLQYATLLYDDLKKLPRSMLCRLMQQLSIVEKHTRQSGVMVEEKYFVMTFLRML